MTGLVSAAAWLVLWSIAWVVIGVPLPVGVVVLVAGLAAAFFVGVFLGNPDRRTDPVSRVEARRRARERFEARLRPTADDERRARLAQAEREAEARAEARVRDLVERRATSGDARADDAGDGASPHDPGRPGAVAPRDDRR